MNTTGVHHQNFLTLWSSSLFNYKIISFSALVFFKMLNDSLLPERLNTTRTSSTKFFERLVLVPVWSAKRSVPIPEEHNIALKFKDDLLNNYHFNLLKRYKANLSLPSSPIIPKNSRSKKLLQITTKDDKILWDLITTLKTGRPLEIHGFYIKNYEKDLHTRDDLVFLDNKILIPAAVRGAFSSMLHKSHPGQFGMKLLAEIFSWPHIYREIYHPNKSCKQCSKAGKKLGSKHTSKYRNFHKR